MSSNCHEISFDLGESHQLRSCLYSQRKDGVFCDIKMNISSNFSIYLHSCVLASFSPCLNSLQYAACRNERNSMFPDSRKFDHSWSCDSPLNLTLSPEDANCPKEVVECRDCAFKLVDFMYLGKINFHMDHLPHLTYLSKILQISDLVSLCERYANSKNVSDSLKRNSVVNSNKQNIQSCEKKVKSMQSTLCPFEGKKAKSAIVYNSEFRKQNLRTDCKLTPSHSVETVHHDILGKLYRCYTCPFSSQKVCELLKHLREADHKEKICSLCMFEAPNCDSLLQHLQQHNDPKPFFCNICNLRFATRTALKLHSPKHSTETPYLCSICSRGFKWKHGLQNHMVVHTTEKKHLCAQCGFSTAHRSTFNAHELVHAGFTFDCPQPGCNFKTPLKRNINAHVATHSNEKPYQCEICGCAFSLAKNLRRHALKHDSSAHFFKCTSCHFQTTRVDKFKCHLIKHHPKSNNEISRIKKKINDNGTNSTIHEKKDVAILRKPECDNIKIKDFENAHVKPDITYSNEIIKSERICGPADLNVNRTINYTICNLISTKRCTNTCEKGKSDAKIDTHINNNVCYTGDNHNHPAQSIIQNFGGNNKPEKHNFSEDCTMISQPDKFNVNLKPYNPQNILSHIGSIERKFELKNSIKFSDTKFILSDLCIGKKANNYAVCEKELNRTQLMEKVGYTENNEENRAICQSRETLDMIKKVSLNSSDGVHAPSADVISDHCIVLSTELPSTKQYSPPEISEMHSSDLVTIGHWY